MKRVYTISACLSMILFAPVSWADIHVILDPNATTPSPMGIVDGTLYDSTIWFGSAASYGTGYEYIGDSPLSGSLSYDAPEDNVDGELSVSSEVGLWYAKAYAESSEGAIGSASTGTGSYANARGSGKFTVDHSSFSIHWIAEGLEGYESSSWSVSLYRYTNIVDYPVETLFTWSSSTDPSEATQSIELDTDSTYILGWTLGIASESNSSEHDEAQLTLSLTDTSDTEGDFSILWISEHHDSVGNLSILSAGAAGYSQVAAVAEQAGAINVEVDDSTQITEALLEPHSLVIIGVSENGTSRSQVEVEALASFVADGGTAFVMCGGHMNAGAYASSISSFFGVNFDLDPASATGTASTFFSDPITEGVSHLSFAGPSYLHVGNPAKLLGMAGEHGMLARRDYGSGVAYFWSDDWVFMNQKLDDADNRRFAENLFSLSQRPVDPEENDEELLIWPLWDGRTWTYHCQDSNGTTWTETRQVIDSNTFDDKEYFRVRIENDCPYAPTETETYVRSTKCALYEWRDSNEVMVITAGPVGVGILNDQMLRYIISEDSITVPYGGPYESYTYGVRGIGDADPYVLASFVQGIGFIKFVEHFGEYAPVVKQLQYIDPDHLCGDYGYPHPIGDLNKDCVVNWTDYSILFEHWLESPFD